MAERDPERGEGEKAERILEAAARVLAREGYGGATVAAVASEAGVSRGLLHYYFESREWLLARVLRRNVGRTAVRLRELAAGCSGPGAFAAALATELRSVAARDPALFTVLAEGLSASRRSEVIARELATLHGRFTAVLEEAFAAWQAEGSMARGRSPRGLAVLVTAVVDGLGLDLVAVSGLAEEPAVWQALEEGLVRLLE